MLLNKRSRRTSLLTWPVLRPAHMPVLPRSYIQSAYISLHGERIFYRIAQRPGMEQAPALVFIHGLVVSGRYFLRLAEQLSRFYRVYLPDLPGFGRSSKPGYTLSIAESAECVYDWMQLVGLESAIVVGQSVGAQIATLLAAYHPACVERLVLLSPTMDPRARCFLRLFIGWLWNMLREPPTLYPILLLDYIECGIPRSLHLLRYACADRMEERLPMLHMPALVMAGAGDTIAPVSWSATVAGLLPQSELCIVPSHIHDLHFSAPAITSQCIHAFLATAG